MKIITVLHWLPVKAKKSGSRVTVYGSNEALLFCDINHLSDSFSFKKYK